MDSLNRLLPPIVYGTSYLGNLYRVVPDRIKKEIVGAWFKSGYDTVVIDSAGKYGAGLALEVLGNLLREQKADPEKILISNKLGWLRVPLKSAEPSFEPGAWAGIEHDAIQKISYQGILDCWEQGNRLIGQDYKPSLVSVHDPDEYLSMAKNRDDKEGRIEGIKQAYRALFELKNQGEVLAVGIGAKDWKTIREIYRDISFDWIMLANSLTVYTHSDELLEFIDKLENDQKIVINSGIFNAGFLTGGQYFNYRIPDKSDPDDSKLFTWRDRFHAVCNDFDLSPSVVCMQFAFTPRQVSSIALNSSKPEKIANNQQDLEAIIPDAFWKVMKEQKLINPDYPYL